jgi:hypothetical protein
MARNTDEQYRALMTGKPIFDYHLSDPKPAKRFKASKAEWVEIHATKGVEPCRLCGHTAVGNLTLHHVVPRSQSGDDVVNNLVSLCGHGTRGCHGLVEARDPWARSLLGQRLTDTERAYVVGKQGAAWLERHYGVKEAA